MLATIFPAWLFRTGRPGRPSPRTSHVQLGLTSLESRLTPTAPVIGSLSGVNIANHWIVTGQLTAGDPSTTTVAISGSVSGNATVRADGTFEFITTQTGGGAVIAEANNADGSDTENADVAPDPGNLSPYLTMSVAYGARKAITLSGNVYDDHPANLTVTFSGSASGTTTTDVNGHYSVILTAISLGTVSASVTNGQSLASNTPSVVLVSNAPVISGLVANNDGSFMLKLRGRVTDEDPAGLIVNFTSTITQVNGRTATVGSDGWFELDVIIMPNTHGVIEVDTADWWGEDSNTASTTI